MKTFLTLIVAATLFGGVAFSAGKLGGLRISFHAEGDKTDGPKMVRVDIVNGKERYFRINPVVTNANFRAFYPFQAEDGKTWGAAFKLDDRGWDAVMDAASNHTGKLLRVVVGDRAVDTQRIDMPKSQDKIIVIWKGLTEEEIESLRSKYPEMGAARR